MDRPHRAMELLNLRCLDMELLPRLRCLDMVVAISLMCRMGLRAAWQALRAESELIA